MLKTVMKFVAALIATALVAGGMFVVVRSLATPETASTVCETNSLRTFANQAEADGDAMSAGLYRQWAEKCDEAKEDGSTPSPEPTTTSPAATAPATPAPSATAEPTETAAAPVAIIEEFLANRPVDTKTSTNAYGPMAAVLPALNGRDMETFEVGNVSDAKLVQDELIYVVRDVDRMQTADKALDLGIVAKNGDENQVNELTARFVNDRAYWDEIRMAVAKRISELEPSIVNVEAGTVVGMSYSVPGTIPQIGYKDVTFEYDTKWIELRDPETGKVVGKYRLHCKFQHGSDWMRQLPTAPKGTGYTPEGETVILFDACRLVGDKWVNVYNVEKKPGDRKLNDAKCAPPTTPTSTPTPTDTPTSTPTPTPTTPPTTPPTCVKKECQTPPAAPPNRDPAPAPTGPKESVAPVEPKPADPTQEPGDPVDLPAPGATQAPAPTAPAPPVEVAPEPSDPGTTDPDPGR